MTTVVNIRHKLHSAINPNYDEYIGRPSEFGNPFRIGVDGSRSEVIAKHMTWARERIQHDPAFRARVKSLFGKRLGCYCSPLACHGDNYVILTAELNAANNPTWNGLTTDGIAAEDQQSIALWAEQTFGLSTQLRAATRMNEEVAELLAKMSNPSASNAKIIEEVADVQIVLYVLASRLHMDLQAEVERKMKINRGRKWVLDGSGCGQHVD